MAVTGDSFSAQDSKCYEAKMNEIILIEQTPLSFDDFREFEIGGKKYQMKDGTFRNNISKLRKAGEVELAFKSRPAFYTISTKNTDKMMTLGRMRIPLLYATFIQNTISNMRYEPMIRRSTIDKYQKESRLIIIFTDALR